MKILRDRIVREVEGIGVDCIYAILWDKLKLCTVPHCVIQYSKTHHSTVQDSTGQYSTVQYSTVQYSTVQCSVYYSNIVQCVKLLFQNNMSQM